MTVGYDAVGLAGYNRIAGATLGAVSFNNQEIDAPFTRILGGASSVTDWGIDDSITFQNKSVADEFDEIEINGIGYTLLPSFLENGGWTRRIQNGPRFTDDISSGTVTLQVNLLRSDNSAYQNAVGVSNLIVPGVYQYIYDGPTGNDGQWVRLVPDALVHTHTIGAPTGDPLPDERIRTTDDGHVYPVGGETHITHVDAQGTSEAFTDPKYVRFPGTLTEVFALGPGGFYFPRNEIARAFQFGNTQSDQFPSESWAEVWQRIIDLTSPTGARLTTVTGYRDSTFLGGHRSAVEAANHMTQIGVTPTQFTAGNYYYGASGLCVGTE